MDCEDLINGSSLAQTVSYGVLIHSAMNLGLLNWSSWCKVKSAYDPGGPSVPAL